MTEKKDFMREVADFVGQKLAPIEGISATVTCFVLKMYKVEGILLDEEKPKDERLLVTPCETAEGRIQCKRKWLS